MANDGEYRMQATEHDIMFLFSVGQCLRFGLRPKPRFSKEPPTKTLCARGVAASRIPLGLNSFGRNMEQMCTIVLRELRWSILLSIISADYLDFAML